MSLRETLPAGAIIALVSGAEVHAKSRGKLSDPTFVGRSEELAAVAACATEADHGRPWVVSIEGGAGDGKTALAHHALGALPEQFTVFAAACDELAQEIDFAVASQIAPITATDPFSAGLELLDKLGELQDRGPLALLIEDLHWADELSRLAIVTALRRLGDDQVLALVTSRPEQVPPDEAWDRLRFDATRCRTVKLSSLSWSEVAELAERCGISLTSAKAKRLARHTNGHPLYTRMLLSELSPAELSDPEAELAAPRSLASSVLAKLAKQQPPAQALASALAVINRRTPLALAGVVADVDDPVAALDALLATGFVTWRPNDEDTPVEFAHPLYRAAVYDDLSASRRQALHRAAAAVVEDDTALLHRVAAADVVDDGLANELEAVARGHRERPVGAPPAKYLLWASSLTSQPELRERRLLEAARDLLAEVRKSAAEPLRPMVEACAPSPLRSLVLGMRAFADGAPGPAESYYCEASSPEATAADPTSAALALVRLGGTYVAQGFGAAAVDAANRALALCPSDDEVARAAWQTVGMGMYAETGGTWGFDFVSERFATPPARLGPGDADLAVTRGMLGFYAGYLEGPLQDLRAAIALAHQGAPLPQLSRAHIHLSNVLFILGDWDEALVNARVALSLITDERNVWMMAQVRSALAAVPIARGHWEEATIHVSESRKAADLLPIPEALGTAAVAEASLPRARGRPADVVAAISPLTQDRRLLPGTIALGWWPVMIGSLIESNELDRAEHELAALRAAAAQCSTELDWRTDVVEAELASARGRASAATAAFERALVGTGRYPSLLDRALTHQAYGRHRHRCGDGKGAVSELRLARQLLEGVGAVPYVERVDRDLQRCGIQAPVPNVASLPNVGLSVTLTPHEQDVAVLVSRGLTNKEVAARLFVSAKTVGYHLGNIFAKLGISSRRDLRDHPVLSQAAANN
jgi:ATP/maltotriose-dependent transcriptional regulator MalT